MTPATARSSGVELVQRRRDRLGGRRVDRVARLGPVDRDDQDAVDQLVGRAIGRGRVIAGAIRIAPSSRIVSPLSIGLSMMCSASRAYSSGLPEPARVRHLLRQRVLHDLVRQPGEDRGVEDAGRDGADPDQLARRGRARRRASCRRCRPSTRRTGSGRSGPPTRRPRRSARRRRARRRPARWRAIRAAASRSTLNVPTRLMRDLARTAPATRAAVAVDDAAPCRRARRSAPARAAGPWLVGDVQRRPSTASGSRDVGRRRTRRGRRARAATSAPAEPGRSTIVTVAPRARPAARRWPGRGPDAPPVTTAELP